MFMLKKAVKGLIYLFIKPFNYLTISNIDLDYDQLTEAPVIFALHCPHSVKNITGFNCV